MLDRPLEALLASRGAIITSESATEFISYRTGLSRKITKIRKDLNIQSKTAKNSNKLKTKSEFDSDKVQEDPRYAVLALLLVERDWANAMETKSLLETNGSSAKRRHVISKLAKSLKHAQVLEPTVLGGSSDGPFPALWKLQTAVLVLLVEAALYFERRLWSRAALAYSKARVGLEAISSVAVEETDKQLIGDLVSATVDPSLGFAVYQADPQKKRSKNLLTYAKNAVLASEDSKTKQFVELVKTVSEKDVAVTEDTKSTSYELRPIVWRSHRATVTNPDLASAIAEAQHKDEHVGELDFAKKEVIDQFDPVLQAWFNALDILSDRIDKVEQGENPFDEDTQTLYIISTYVKYSLIFRRIQRDTIIIKKLKDKEASKTKLRAKLNVIRDIVRVFDGTIQSSTELLDLPGVFNDEQLSATLETVKKYFQAQKIATLAYAYKLAGENLNALALYELASKTLTKLDPISVEVHGKVVTEADVTAAVTKITHDLEKSHALAHIEATYKGATKNLLEVPISDTLSIYPYGDAKSVVQRIVDLQPSRLLPVPVKPAFFDIAYNYIEYDSVSKADVFSKAASAIGLSSGGSSAQQTEQAKKGGLLSGIWGRK